MEKLDFRGTRTIRLLRCLVEAHDWFFEHAEPEIRSYGLGVREFDCLVNLGVAQPLRMCDLAQRTLSTKSHVTQVVKALESRGLMHRERSRENEREVYVTLTDEGQQLFERIYPVHYQFLQQLFDAKLSPEEQCELTELLCKLRG